MIHSDALLAVQAQQQEARIGVERLDPSAFLNRQGYYAAVLSTAQRNMDAYEWAYWMEGKPAAQDIKAPDGTVMEKAGTVRDGGSYEARMGSVACWNAVMDENDYMVRKWNDFIAA